MNGPLSICPVTQDTRRHHIEIEHRERSIDPARLAVVNDWGDELIREAVGDVADYGEALAAYRKRNARALGEFFLREIDKHVDHLAGL